MTAINNNKYQSTMVPLPTSYSLTNSSLESNRSNISDQDVIIGEQWIVLAKIGEGSFGEVFEVKDIDTGRHYAVKREPWSCHPSQIKNESILYDILAAGPGIPQCHWYGRHDDFECIVMDLLGSSLKQLCQSVHHIPLPIVMDLGCQIIDILEHIHNRGLLYRDVKPENFLFSHSCQLPGKFGIKDNDNNKNEQWDDQTFQELYTLWGKTKPKVFLVDLGLATCWRNLDTKQPYPECKKRIRNKTGTARYASLNVHRGKTPARRDDMESLGYMLVDLALGDLPWNGIQARSSKAGWDMIYALKRDTRTIDLCVGLPRGIKTFIDYTRLLGFADEPDYNYLRRLLLSSCAGNSFTLAENNMTDTQRPEKHESTVLNTKVNKSRHITDDVFVMDDLANDLLDLSLDNKLSTIITHQGGGRRRRNSKKSFKWNGGGGGQRQQQNDNSAQSQQNRYNAPQRTLKHACMSSTSQSRHQQHGLADPWSRYHTTTFNHHGQHYGGSNLV
ncbi:kinase-like domain-containing protein [Chlamydoabsidia padenii]|nr:kinase-like domain-containing protein [Chlamydoabsidia padenii]